MAVDCHALKLRRKKNKRKIINFGVKLKKQLLRIGKGLIIFIPMFISTCSAIISYQNAKLSMRNSCYSDFSKYNHDISEVYRNLMVDFSLFANEPENANYLQRANSATFPFVENVSTQIKLLNRYKYSPKSVQLFIESINYIKSIRASMGGKEGMPRIDLISSQARNAIKFDPQNDCCEQ